MKHVMVVVGTRPEAIKLAPVIHALQREESIRCTVLATAQHRQMLDQVFSAFNIKPDIDLNIMQSGQSLTDLTARLLIGIQEVLVKNNPDAILVQGDTTTVLSAAMAAFYQKIPVGHIEAGLRTNDILNPFPEEMNRVLTSRLAKWHFAPTDGARTALLKEGIDKNFIYVTGNTVIDALLSVASKDNVIPIDYPKKNRMVLVTTHRRENFGEPLKRICEAVLTLADMHGDDTQFVFPVHPNPHVKDVVVPMLGRHEAISLISPLDYLPFVSAMKQADIILTDSGGVQEEAPALGKPVLVMRADTERPEAVEQGVVKLVGSDYLKICDEVTRLLDDPIYYSSMARGVSPYGDGFAAGRIVKTLVDYFK